MKDLAKEMDEIRESITRHHLSLDEIEEWLELNRPDHFISLVDDAPDFIPYLLDHLAADAEQGFETVRRGKKASKHYEPTTAFSIWKDSLDLETLSGLTKPSKPAVFATIDPRSAPTVETPNQFGDLIDDDDSIPPDDDVDAPKWAWMAASSSSTPSSDNRPPKEIPAAPAPASLPLPPSAADDPYASPFSSPARFVSVFGTVPRVPTSRKSITVLEGESLWAMSKDERTRLFADWYGRAWEEASERQFAKLERARKDHDKYREQNEQLRTQVRKFSYPSSLASNLFSSSSSKEMLMLISSMPALPTPQSRLTLLAGCEILACTSSGAAKMASLIKASSSLSRLLVFGPFAYYFSGLLRDSDPRSCSSKKPAKRSRLMSWQLSRPPSNI